MTDPARGPTTEELRARVLAQIQEAAAAEADEIEAERAEFGYSSYDLANDPEPE